MRTDRTGEGSPPLILPGAAREALFREAESARPVECCGFLLGREDRRGRFVEEIRPARNRERSGRAFFIPPRVFWREEVRARRAGLVILGFYHSHPSDPPIPSREDLRLSWPGRSSLIVGGDRSIRSWIRRRGETSFREERIGGNAPRSLAPPEPAYEAPTIPAVPIVAGGAPEEDGHSFTPEETSRFARHIVLPEIGPEGQKRLRRSRVLVAGAGGLGSPVLLYLAAAGVGRIGVADPDRVDLTNLQRQILHRMEDLDRPKTASAAEKIGAIDPGIEVEAIEEAIRPENALDRIRGYDLVVDGTDNLASRYLLADASAILGVPMLHGSVDRFGGQAALFPAGGRPCYRCLYPEPPPPGAPPAPPAAGVFGPLPGVIGAFLASEAIKTLLGAGESLAGKLFLADLLHLRFRTIRIPRDPGCPLCGDKPSIRSLDPALYEEAGCFSSGETGPCREKADRRALEGLLEAAGAPPLAAEHDLPAIRTIDAASLRRRLDGGDPPLLVDVRRPLEREIARIDGALPLPMEELPARAAELDRGAEIILFCRSGIRSARAAMLLRLLGFERVLDLEGGILAWIDAAAPGSPRY